MRTPQHTPWLGFIVVACGMLCIFPGSAQAVNSPYYILDLVSDLDSQPKQALAIGLLESGAPESLDVIPPPEPSGFDFYIASGLSMPWDRLSLYLIPRTEGQSLYSWRVVVTVPASQAVAVYWDASTAPGELSLCFTEMDAMAGEPMGDPQDMTTVTSFTVQGGLFAPVTKVFEFQVQIASAGSQDYPTEDCITEVGEVISGCCLDTQKQDDLAETLTEIVVEKGKPSKRHDELSHVWSFDVTGGESVVFCLDACKTASPDGDDFLFSYSTDGIAYADMLTVTNTVDDDRYQFCPLPGTIRGTVYVRARDTDRSSGNQNPDVLYVDHMFFLCGDDAPDLPPAAPRDLMAVVGDEGVILDWADNGENDLDHYRVYRSFSPEGPYDGIGEAVQSAYLDSPIADQTSSSSSYCYYYVVTAVDKAGQESTFSSVAAAVSGASFVMQVSSIEMFTILTAKKWSAVAIATVLSQNGDPVEGAAVSYMWSDIHRGAGEALTDSDGVVRVVSDPSPKSGTTIFTVIGVVKTDYVFNQETSVTSGSVIGP